MSRYFRWVFLIAIAFVLFVTANGCCCYPRPCCPPTHCHASCAPACAPHACCPQPVCPQFWPLNSGHFSEPMHPYLDAQTGQPRLMPQSGLKTLMNATP